jgi:hypothetical protein
LEPKNSNWIVLNKSIMVKLFKINLKRRKFIDWNQYSMLRVHGHDMGTTW